MQHPLILWGLSPTVLTTDLRNDVPSCWLTLTGRAQMLATSLSARLTLSLSVPLSDLVFDLASNHLPPDSLTWPLCYLGAAQN